MSVFKKTCLFIGKEQNFLWPLNKSHMLNKLFLPPVQIYVHIYIHMYVQMHASMLGIQPSGLYVPARQLLITDLHMPPEFNYSFSKDVFFQPERQLRGQSTRSPCPRTRVPSPARHVVPIPSVSAAWQPEEQPTHAQSPTVHHRSA